MAGIGDLVQNQGALGILATNALDDSQKALLSIPEGITGLEAAGSYTLADAIPAGSIDGHRNKQRGQLSALRRFVKCPRLNLFRGETAKEGSP